jgi:hypothetical protein
VDGANKETNKLPLLLRVFLLLLVLDQLDDDDDNDIQHPSEKEKAVVVPSNANSTISKKVLCRFQTRRRLIFFVIRLFRMNSIVLTIEQSKVVKSKEQGACKECISKRVSAPPPLR